MFLHSLAYFFQLGYQEQEFKCQIFYSNVYGNMVEENRMYQQLQKFCMENVCCMKVFRGNLSKICLHPQKMLAPTPMKRVLAKQSLPEQIIVSARNDTK